MTKANKHQETNWGNTFFSHHRQRANGNQEEKDQQPRRKWAKYRNRVYPQKNENSKALKYTKRHSTSLKIRETQSLAISVKTGPAIPGPGIYPETDLCTCKPSRVKGQSLHGIRKSGNHLNDQGTGSITPGTSIQGAITQLFKKTGKFQVKRTL